MADAFQWKIHDLGAPIRATQLPQWARAKEGRPLLIDLSDTQEIYPNGAIAFSSTLAFLQNRGAEISVRLPNASLGHLTEPLTLDGRSRSASHSSLTNSVWCYRSEREAQRLANNFMDALTDSVQCEEGVIDVINWCLYEVMDNVFQHSLADAGYVMMQLHRRQRLCVVAVGDTGIGIQRSLVTSGAADIQTLLDPGASINHALKQGVTSKGGLNQGNGLFGLRRSVELNGGELSVRSGWGQWCLKDGEVSHSTDRRFPLPDNSDHQSTLVDWRLDCSRKVKIDQALGGQTHEGGAFLESIEDDEGVHRISVNDIEESLGSRKLGSEIRVRLSNYINAGAAHVVLDFKGVGVVSSSFADEVLAKLAIELGELEFRRRVFVEGATTTNRRLIETAISTRLASSSKAASNT